MNPDRANPEQVDRPNGGGPPQVRPNDPIAPATHDAGGTYAEADYSVAAQRSKYHIEQFNPGPPHRRAETPELRSGLAEANRCEPIEGKGDAADK